MNTDRLFLVAVPLLRPINRTMARDRRSQFEAAAVPVRRVVFLGDSITEQGHWDAWFPELPTLNRGIGGDTTEDLFNRLDSAIADPAIVSLLVGTNDLHGSRRLRDLNGIASRVRELVQRIQDLAPTTTLLVNSVMPRTALLAPKIRSLNESYAEIAADTSSVYVDLWPALADGDALRKEFTRDNLHLLGPGYRAWADVLRPHLVTGLKPPTAESDSAGLPDDDHGPSRGTPQARHPE